jgi:hypothetical protein
VNEAPVNFAKRNYSAIRGRVGLVGEATAIVAFSIATLSAILLEISFSDRRPIVAPSSRFVANAALKISLGR